MMRQFILLLASCMALAACGGGDSGSKTTNIGGGSPSPTASATPVPTTSSPNTGEVKPAADASFLAATMEMTTVGGSSETNGVITGGATTGRNTTLDTPQFTGSYTTASGYRLSDAVNAATFGAAQLRSDTTATNGNGTVLFASASGAIEDYLALYQSTTYTSSIKGSGYTTARYGGIGGWQHTVVDGSSRHTRVDYLAFGTPTPVAAMPHSGVVTFSILSYGNYATDTDLWFLTAGNGNVVTIDFASGTITGSIGFGGQNFYKSEVGGIGGIPVNGSFAGSNSATISFPYGSLGSSGAVPGRFHLLFIGPNANELIITYIANDGGHALVGAAIGLIDPYRN